MPCPLGTDGSAIGTTGKRPLRWTIRTWIFSCFFLINIDAQTWFLIGIHIAVSHLRTARKDLLQGFVEATPLLDAKVRAIDIQMQIGGMADGGSIVMTIPGPAVAHIPTELSHFFSSVHASDLTAMD